MSIKISKEMQYASFRITNFLYADNNIDKNKVTDFTPIFELHAPALSILWTTPQKYFFSKFLVNLSIVQNSVGCSDFNPKN